MKVFIPLGLFFIVVATGFIFVPVPLNVLAWCVVLLAIVEWVVYRFVRWLAASQRIGVVVEPFSSGEEIKFFNNPWAKGWERLTAIYKLLIALQISWLAAGSLMCGEMMRLIIFRP